MVFACFRDSWPRRAKAIFYTDSEIMLTADTIDWNRLWTEERTNPNKHRDKEFWNKRAPSFTTHARGEGYDEYATPFLKIIDPQPEWTVLDVGCGAGTMAHPLAQVVRKVTAIDFSPSMIDLLEQQTRKLGLTNLEARVVSWEDDWSAAGIEPHDVAIASRSMIAPDPRTLLRKLSSFARQQVFITLPVGNGPGDQKVLEALGRPAIINPDYIYVVNLLHQMGVNVNVHILERAPRRYQTREQAEESVRWVADEMTKEEEALFARYIDENVKQVDGLWQFTYERNAHWAVLWWKADALK
ncbi:MAG: class I SAM-dependent methyltransferase [Acidobacteriota bacterium]|nr:class I SAM-dependent methyltransferase [Acidobacteriota bacterium]